MRETNTRTPKIMSLFCNTFVIKNSIKKGISFKNRVTYFCVKPEASMAE